MKTVICHDVHGNTTEVPVSELSFRPSQYGVIIKDGKVLLVPQWDGYDFPGGGLELGESLEEGLKREIREETGLESEVKDAILVTQDYYTHAFSGKKFQCVLIYYVCEAVGGEITDANFDSDEKKYAKKAEWVPLEKVTSLKFYNPIDSVGLIQKCAGLHV
jgi:8-oxo-dGTP diphosphatase